MRTSETFDYRARGGVLDSFIITRDDAPAWAHDRSRLWNEAERADNRANARLATELELALPYELSAAERREVVAGFVREIVDRYGVAADVAIHAPGKDGDHRNHHAHVLLTHRELGPDGFGEIANVRTKTRKRKGREVEEKIAGIAATPADITAIRKEWEKHENRAYERAGLDIRVDHRSHEDRGIEAEPSKHLGPSAAGMERRGMDSDRGDANREITMRNAERERLAELAAQAAAIKAELANITHYDRDAAESAWLDAVANAAVAKDQAEQSAQEARQRPGRGDGLDQHPPAARGPYAPLQMPEPAPETERPLTGTAAEIRAAFAMSNTATELEDALAARGISLARVSADEAYASERRAALAKEAGNFVPVWREGEIVAVDGRGTAHRLNERTTGDERPEIEGRLVGIERAALMSVADTQEAMRAASLAAWKDERRAEREQARPPSVIEAAIADALRDTITGTDFAAALDEKGLTVARVTAADVLALEALREHDRTAGTFDETASGRRFADLMVGDFAAVTHQGDVLRLSPQKLDFEDIEQRLADVQTRLPSIVEARASIEENRERKTEERAQRQADFIADRIEQAAAFAGKQELRQATRAAEEIVHTAFETPVAAADLAIDTAGRTVGGIAKAVIDVIGGFFNFFAGGPPKLTPIQAELAEKAADEQATDNATRDVAATRAARLDDLLNQIARSDDIARTERHNRTGGATSRDQPLERDDDYGRERER